MLSPSRILKPDHVTVDFLTEIVPDGLLRLELLYQHSTEAALAKKDLERWDYLNNQAVRH